MEKRMYEAALEGSVSTLKALIQEDPLILDGISPTFFQDTPLYIATLRGHFEFAQAVLHHNPRLATEADSLGHLPLHVASIKGHLEIVRELIRVVGPSSCLARSKDGKLPLHMAIMKGVRVEVVRELARACLESTWSRLDRGDTALHLCVKYENLDTFQVIVEELLKGGIDGNNLLNAKNDDGNTVLHLAALQKHLEITKYLLATPGIEPNAMNNNGLTALDLVENSARDLKGLELLNFLLRSKGNQGSTSIHSSITPTETQPVTLLRPKKSWKIFFTFNGHNQLEDMKGVIFITAAILAAVNALPIIYMRVNGPDITDQYAINSASFVPSVTIMLLLIAGFPLSNKLCAWVVIQSLYTAVGFLGLNYIGEMISNENRYPSNMISVVILVLIWFGLLCLVSALNIIRLVVWIVNSIKIRMKRRRLCDRRENALASA